MNHHTLIRLVEALYNARLALDGLGKKAGPGMLKYNLSALQLDLTAVLNDLGYHAGTTAADADNLKLALLAKRDEAPSAPHAAVTVELEKDTQGIIPHETLTIISGGIPTPIRWTDYILRQPAVLRPHLDAIYTLLKGLPAYPEERVIFLSSDGLRIGFTERAWGDVKAAIANQEVVRPHETYLDHTFG